VGVFIVLTFMFMFEIWLLLRSPSTIASTPNTTHFVLCKIDTDWSIHKSHTKAYGLPNLKVVHMIFNFFFQKYVLQLLVHLAQ